MAPSDGWRLRLDGAADGRVLQPPAVLRPRYDRRGGEGLTDRSTPERRWRAIALATVLVTVSFWALFYGLGEVFGEGIAALDEEAFAQGSGGILLSLALVPAVYLVATFGSSRIDSPIMTLAGMGLWSLVAFSLLLFRNPLAALISGYAAGAVVTLSRPDRMPLRNRWIAAACVAVFVHVGLLLVPLATAWLAPALPFTAMGLADLLTEIPPEEDDAIDLATT